MLDGFDVLVDVDEDVSVDDVITGFVTEEVLDVDDTLATAFTDSVIVGHAVKMRLSADLRYSDAHDDFTQSLNEDSKSRQLQLHRKSASLHLQ